jgi:hypothetical protein
MLARDKCFSSFGFFTGDGEKHVLQHCILAEWSLKGAKIPDGDFSSLSSLLDPIQPVSSFSSFFIVQGNFTFPI